MRVPAEGVWRLGYSEVSDRFTDLLKWMVVLWTGTVLAVITTGLLT